MQPSATHQQNTRQLYFIQRSKGMLTMPRTAISAELVGITQLQKPSPKLKARMAVWRVIPMRSARGSMMGITAAAWPDPDGMTVLIRRLAMNMAGP